ncbi:hypothetical protein M2132_000559 [Dysgonomonas sp. PH5-45]|uniref:winged helix DNA-binding domain-containing protein n=1 Tax=unclassified Dysgonomonas TaxID=2630389 RepID=UPI002474048B|nr:MULTISPECIES: winged helix DNA-binding domain-containing protein [unclassified Dysgonomonas]MDH6354232.1 hypothetical protein [Dysgonomonas sp. PH5-45]MDH6387133.1 hypothetical protein [Dysgonomonas sp. PH5-37]
MQKIKNIRTVSQQLSNQKFTNPKDVVAWMGAIQAQEYNMAKWAVGIRTKNATLQLVDEALSRGDILRIHLLRPTWHFVTPENIRWMLQLSAQRIKSAFASYNRKMEITESMLIQTNRLIEKLLEGNKSLTREEIGIEFSKTGIEVDNPRMNHFMMYAETEGIVCSGIDKNKKPTYSLLDERVPPAAPLHKEEALAKLALIYFQSHSPATPHDFVWWSGLSLTESRQAISSIKDKLIEEQINERTFYIHEHFGKITETPQIAHLLPSFDEYLISYKDRTAVLDMEHHPKAFTNFGIFYPVVMHRGQIIGNWKKSVKKNSINLDIKTFEPDTPVNKNMLESAKNKYRKFMQNY